MRLAHGMSNSLVVEVGGKTYSVAGIAVGISGDQRVVMHSNGEAIKADNGGVFTGAIYINDGRFVNALWLFVGAE